jgi:hypothetical protein
MSSKKLGKSVKRAKLSRNPSLFLVLVFLSLGGALLPLMGVQLDGYTVNASGAAISTINPNSTIQAENHIVSSSPGTFTGININHFVGANTFYSAGYTGTNATMLNIEAGHIWSGHELLGHTIHNNNTASGALNEADRHATQVGAAMGGRLGGSSPDGYQQGIAHGATLRSSAIATKWLGSAYAGSFDYTVESSLDHMASVLGQANVANSSFGFMDPSSSSGFAWAYDAITKNNPRTTWVFAAGNSGPSGNTVGAPASGYNGISVGATGPGNAYTTVASFSSRGPQNYSDPVNGIIAGVRAPVDILAPGQTLTLAFYGGQTGGNGIALPGSTLVAGTNLYSGGVNGTSFAAPIVAGGATLLNDASISLVMSQNSRDSRVIKAVLMNSADKLAGWTNNPTVISGASVTTQGVDFVQGAGQMNLTKAYTQYIEGVQDVAGSGGGSIGAVGWDFGGFGNALANNDYPITTILLGGTNLTATLAWFRDRTYVPGSFVASDDSFANLDLQLWDSAFTTMFASSQGLYDSNEHLSLTIPATGSYGIRVSRKNNMFGALAGIDYGLAWSATAIPEPSYMLTLGTAALLVTSLRHRRGYAAS